MKTKTEKMKDQPARVNSDRGMEVQRVIKGAEVETEVMIEETI
jgi:hypothetical protein